MTEIDNPTGLSDYDFLEFECFASKVKREGFSYAAEHYGPRFETAELNERAATPAGLKALYREYRPAVQAWYEKVGGKRACDLHNAHVHETRRRKADACLWGIRCTNGYVIHCHTEGYRDATVARLLHPPAALLRRAAPGDAWTEIPQDDPGSDARGAAIQAVKDHPSTTFMAPYESLAAAVLDAAAPLIRAQALREAAAELIEMDDMGHAPRELRRMAAEVGKGHDSTKATSPKG